MGSQERERRPTGAQLNGAPVDPYKPRGSRRSLAKKRVFKISSNLFVRTVRTVTFQPSGVPEKRFGAASFMVRISNRLNRIGMKKA